MITEDYVSFESAKLLKEKGFDEKCRAIYTFWLDEVEGPTEDKAENWNIEPRHFSAPTLQMARKWLIENYNIHIEVRYFPMPNIYRYVIIHTPATFENIGSHPQYFNTYEEACETAIKYCLENLI